MNRRTALVIGMLAGAFVAVALIARQFGPVERKVVQPGPAQTVEDKRELVGVNSCSASACHGGVDANARLSEATTWRALDPHARSYATLLSRESRQIAKLLWDGEKQAHEEALCLKCHVHPNYDQARPNFRKQDGVGCESCHGAAGQWLTPHYRPNWKTSLGMLETKNLYGRANICVTCHVGTPAASVNHDMIAAGHPPLRFEFATYFANLPPHWDVARDRKTNTPESGFDFDAQAWLVGQLVSSAAAADLRAYRADPKNGNVWPEFAELNCSSCHHDLQDTRWRVGLTHSQKQRPGSLQLSDWYDAMPFAMRTAIRAGPSRPTDTRKALSLFRDRDELAKQSKAYALEQRAIAQTVQFQGDHVGVLKILIARFDKDESMNADFATQFYLALLAVRPHYHDEAFLNRLRKHGAVPPAHLAPKRMREPDRSR